MRIVASSVLVLLAGMGAAKQSVAAASARVSISNGVSVSIEHTGYADAVPESSSQVFQVSLNPGQTTDFSFNYAISVADDGLPVEPLRPGSGLAGCISLEIGNVFCGPPIGVDREQAAGTFLFLPSIDNTPPHLQWTVDGPQMLELQTNADSLADRQAQSGTTRVHVVNSYFLPERMTFFVIAAAWVLASPIPEPTTLLHMAAGLALLPVVRSMYRRRNCLK